MSRSIKTDIFGDPIQKATINRKLKGNKNELYAAKLFSDWTGFSFHRVPGSGGLDWGKDHRVSGDIVAGEESDFPFSVETKHLKSVTYSKDLRSNSKIFRIWAQCERDANNCGKIPLLFIRGNRWDKDRYLLGLSLPYAGLLLVRIKEESRGILPDGNLLYLFDSRVVMKGVAYKHFLQELKLMNYA